MTGALRDFEQLERRAAECRGMREGEQGTGNAESGSASGSGSGSANEDGTLRRGADIAQRLLALAGGILGLARMLPRDLSGKHVASQLVRSGTSAGANYEEARAAESRADFVHKVRIAAKEMRETIFWLKLVHRAGLLRSSALPTLERTINESNELAAILMASARTARHPLQR